MIQIQPSMLDLTRADLDVSKHNTGGGEMENDSNIFAHPMSSGSALVNCSFDKSSLEISSAPGTITVTGYSRCIYQGIANICLGTSNTA